MVVGPNVDSKLVVRALRGGADDYVDEEDIEADLEVALGRLKRELAAQSGEGGRVIAVLAPSGGSGSSTLAANIATMLAKEHKSAVLVDLKLETGDLAALLDLKPTHTLADLCQNVARIDRVMFERSLDAPLQRSPPAGLPLAVQRHPPRDPRRGPQGPGDGQAHVPVRRHRPGSLVSRRTGGGAPPGRPDPDRPAARLRLAAKCPAHPRLPGANWVSTADRMQVVVNRYGQPKEVPFAKAEEASA